MFDSIPPVFVSTPTPPAPAPAGALSPSESARESEVVKEIEEGPRGHAAFVRSSNRVATVEQVTQQVVDSRCVCVAFFTAVRSRAVRSRSMARLTTTENATAVAWQATHKTEYILVSRNTLVSYIA